MDVSQMGTPANPLISPYADYISFSGLFQKAKSAAMDQAINSFIAKWLPPNEAPPRRLSLFDLPPRRQATAWTCESQLSDGRWGAWDVEGETYSIYRAFTNRRQAWHHKCRMARKTRRPWRLVESAWIETATLRSTVPISLVPNDPTPISLPPDPPLQLWQPQVQYEWTYGVGIGGLGQPQAGGNEGSLIGLGGLGAPWNAGLADSEKDKTIL